MNYRHRYHAGNFADVFKHAILVLLLRRLLAKETPLLVLDTHAGIGRYDLASPEAQKTGEFRAGIARLMAEPEPPTLLAPYLDLVRAANPVNSANPRGALRHYPGSPAIAALLLRPEDRIIACELHPEDAQSLKREFASDRRVAIHHQDGYRALKAFLPPPERRGLVLIDPPFETTDEAEKLLKGLAQAHRRFPGGCYALWYPLKDRAPVEAWQRQLRDSGIRRILVTELLVQSPLLPDRLNGAGLVVINPPWRIEAEIEPLLAALAPRLAQGAGAGGICRWLVPE